MGKNPFQNFVVRFHGGQSVFDEGEAGATMYIVQSGCVRLFRKSGERTIELGTMEKGDFFGEMSILEGLPRTMSAVADGDSELIEINSTTFDRMIKGNIEIAIRMLRKLSIRLREAERRLEEARASGGRPESTARPAPTGSTPQPINGGQRGIRLELEDHSGVFPLDGDEILIGRFDPVTELKPDVDLTDVDLKRSVSRRHARIVSTDSGHALVEEVGALNGTFVNGTQLVAGEPHPIQDGDTLGMGMVKLVFRT